MLVLAVVPVACSIGGIVLVMERRKLRFGWFDWFALAVGAVAVVLGGLLIVTIVGSMRGMGIV